MNKLVILIALFFTSLALAEGKDFTKSDLEKVKASNSDESTGVQIVNKAIETPLRTIVENLSLIHI